jgi:hypothetical protein
MILFLILFMGVGLISAQEQSDSCGAEALYAQINQFLTDYEASQSEEGTSEGALESTIALRDSIGSVVDRCANLAAPEQPTVGDGSLNNPFAFGTFGDTGYGFSLRVSGLIRPADSIIRNANRFNDRPDTAQAYVILNVDVRCDQNNTGRCEASTYDFELVGDSGTIYSNPSVVYDDELEAELFGGGEASGGLPFLIRSDETNLRLLYRPNRFDDDMVAFAAEPSTESGIEIMATSSVNIRSNPGTQFGVVGTLPASTPAIAFGRNQDGTWLQTSTGWVFAELVAASGDIQSLPVIAP